MTDSITVTFPDNSKDIEIQRMQKFSDSLRESYPLHEAAKCYDHEKLLILLQENQSYPVKDRKGRTPLHVLLEDGFLGHLNEPNMIACTSILIDYQVDVNSVDDEKRTALALSVDNIFPKCTTLLLEAGAHSTLTIATKIAHTMPKILLEIFDNGVSVDENRDGDITVTLDWKPILQYPPANLDTSSKPDFKHQQKETQFLYNLLSLKFDVRNDILNHPLVTAFLHFKTKKMTSYFRWFYLITILYPLFYGVFIYFLYFDRCAFHDNDEADDEENGITSSTTPTSRPGHFRKVKCEITGWITVWSSILCLILGIWFLLELYMQLRVDRKYLLSWRTWTIRLAIVVMAVTLWPGLQYNKNYSISFQYPIASIGIFLAWVMFLIQITLYHKFSIYLEMLVKILVSVVKITLMFLPLFIGFYMGFSLMFSNVGVFSFIMMAIDIGASEYETIIDDAKENAEWFEILAQTFCVLFIVIIVIVFMNYLLALSIQDVGMLRGQAESTSTSREIQNCFIADLAHPNSVIVSQEDVQSGKCYYKFNPRAEKQELPPKIILSITMLLKQNKLKRDKMARKRIENLQIQKKAVEDDVWQTTKILMQRIEEMEQKLDATRVKLNN